MKAIFRPYSPAGSRHSDRSAGDRLRHRKKVRNSIRENIADVISEEAIIGRSKDTIIKVPIRGIKEYRFIYGEDDSGVGTGDGSSYPGKTVGKKRGKGEGPGSPGDKPGVDYYETDITLEELIEIMFEDLELPRMEQKHLRLIPAERKIKRKGYRRAGPRVRLDKRRTVLSRIRRKITSSNSEKKNDEENNFPFHNDDLIYRHIKEDVRFQSNAVVICIMDTSGSMDTVKKYLARSFFFLLYQFVSAKYQNVEVVFIAHHTEAKEVTEEQFFHKGESGGTLISSGYKKALSVIEERYHPSMWNIYSFHCSDGDNFSYDNDGAALSARKLCEVCNLFGYGEIKPQEDSYYGDSMIKFFGKRLKNHDNFKEVLMRSKEDIWPAFKKFLKHDRGE
ncbi:MAG: sporulation protein YhbH [Patescibacteria group bacterium]|nr:MAG: sporulation protein YhbH [Patescibacteria group bacterium]